MNLNIRCKIRSVVCTVCIFIISMLTEKLGKKSKNRKDIFNHLQRVRVSDNKMKRLRDKYFNK